MPAPPTPRHGFSVLALACALLGGLAPSVAHEARASSAGALQGTVVDDSGAPLPGVTVTAVPLDGSSSERSAVTGPNGAYRLPLLEPGKWEVRFQLEGFSTVVHRVRVRGDRPVRLDTSLPLASISEEIVVTSGSRSPVRHSAPLRPRLPALPAGIDPDAWSRSDFDTEAYDPLEENRFLDPHDHPLSTFAIDVDSASYANVRRFLTRGERPPRDAVRIEELVNAYPAAYSYEAPPGDGVSVHVDVADAPWEPRHRLVRVGLVTRELDRRERPTANLVFLLDVSGSMDSPEKLPWVVESMRMLVDALEPRDRIGIVVYAGASGVVLESTHASDRAAIFEALGRLRAGGSTNGGAGIEAAYRMVERNFVEGGINRVVLATDGDWNVGTTGTGDLVRLVRERAQGRIALTVLGFGMGNYRDELLEKLSNEGDGNSYYIDRLAEARKVLVEQLGGTLAIAGRDVKVQVELNPALVAGYRLIGYENRLLADEDFDDDAKDGGEIGAGHSVTALYEIVPVGETGTVAVPSRRQLRYQRRARLQRAADSGELLTVAVRAQPPEGGRSRRVETVAVDPGAGAEMAPDFAFAAGLASFGMLLRDSPHRGAADWDLVSGLLAQAADGPVGPATEVAQLVALARGLVPVEVAAHRR